MEILSRTFDTNKVWRRTSYQVPDGGKRRRNMKTVRFGESNVRFWKIKAAPRLRCKILVSPLRLWTKLKNACSGKKQNVVSGETKNESRKKRASKVHHASMGYTNEEFNNRLIFEIYKNMIPSHELAPTM